MGVIDALVRESRVAIMFSFRLAVAVLLALSLASPAVRAAGAPLVAPDLPSSPVAGDVRRPPRSLPATVVGKPPQVDGDLSDPCWADAAHATEFVDPATGEAPEDGCEAWLAYDEEAVYVAFYAHDAHPDAIVARETRQDAEFMGEDTVTFSLDPFHTHRFEDLSSFTVNALGTQRSRIGGGRAGKMEWKGEWRAAARRVADGWTAEMAIPWEVLSYPSRKAPATLGINFMRKQARTQVVSYWSNLGLRTNPLLAGHWEGVQLPVRAFRRQVSLLPYMAPGTRASGRSVHAGIDARAVLSPELTVVGTVNPDFESIEAAVEGIEFSRGERYVPDARPFFLEGGDLFDFGGGRGFGRLFFSRRVPGFDAGGKLYGKIGAETSLGLLGTMDVGRRMDWVGRVSRRVGENSSVGAMVVRRDAPGDENMAIGMDQNLRRGDWFLRNEWAMSSGPEAGGDARSTSFGFAGDRVQVTARHTQVAPDFRAADGYIPFVDYHGWGVDLRYRNEWRHGPLRSLQASIGALDHRHTDGAFFRRTGSVDLYAQTRGDLGLSLGWDGGRFENERDSVITLGFTANTSDRRRRWGLLGSFGRRADAPMTYLAPQVSFRLFGGYDVGLQASFLRHVEERAQHALTVSRELDPGRSIGLRMVVRDGQPKLFVSYRRAGLAGVETTILFGDPDPNARGFSRRLVTKVVWPMK
jgi:hypothetical protein